MVQRSPQVNFGGQADNELMLPEQARLSAALTAAIADVDGVRAAIPIAPSRSVSREPTLMRTGGQVLS